MHKFITISGSMRYWEEILHHGTRLSVEGNIVLIPFKDPDKENIPKSRKEMYIEVHNERIDISEELFVVNKDGYIGSSTRNEILYALRNKKHVEFLERPSVEYIGNLLLTVTHFQRIDVLKCEFQRYMEELLSAIYYNHLLSITGKYNFVTSTQTISNIQTKLDLLFEVTKHCMDVNAEMSIDELQQMYQPVLNEIFDNIEDIIDMEKSKFPSFIDGDSNISIPYEISWTLSELMYATASELLASLDK